MRLQPNPHSDADQIAAACGVSSGSVSTQAVYDVLEACVGRGSAATDRACGFPGTVRDENRDNHHHLVCRGVRHGRRRRLRRRPRSLPRTFRQSRLRDRRSRGRVLGSLRRLPKNSAETDSRVGHGLAESRLMCPEPPRRPSNAAHAFGSKAAPAPLRPGDIAG